MIKKDILKIEPKRLEEILNDINKVKVGVVGDICLDFYWRCDMTKSELSRETPHYPLPVVKEWISTGAAGNVAANVARIGAREVFAVGIIGNDWRKDILIKELQKNLIDVKAIIVSSNRITPAYCKPFRMGISRVEYEDPRIDFDNYSPPSQEEEDALISELHRVAGKVDILCVSDQMKYGCITQRVRECIIEMAKEGLMVVVDSRERIKHFTNVILKPNEVEGYRAVNSKEYFGELDLKEGIKIAKTLARKNFSKVCLTLGDKGCIYYEENSGANYIPACEVNESIDVCGAGDTFLSAFSCALAAGVPGPEAAAFAGIASDVTIRKIGTTGTASSEEIKNNHKQMIRLYSQIKMQAKDTFL